MDITVQQLRALVAVADELSFTRASSLLDVSPSTVSELVSTLERRLGLTLFTRSSRSVAPTQAATAVLPLARNAVAGIDAVITWAGSADAHPHVTVGVMASSARFRSLVEESTRAMPEVAWSIRQLDFRNPIDALRQHQIDCAFVADLAPPRRLTSVRSYALWQERLLLAVREDHRLVDGTGVAMADLSNESLICGPDGLQNKQWFATIRAQIPGNPRILATAHNLEEVVEMCATGIGVTVVTESVMEMFHRPGLAYVPLRGAPLATMRLLVRSNDPSRPLARFVDNARQRHHIAHV